MENFLCFMAENNSNKHIANYTYRMIGYCYLLLGNYEKSTQFHTMSSDINPLDVMNFSTLSESLTLEGKYNASQEALKQSDIPQDRFFVMQHGETRTLNFIEN